MADLLAAAIRNNAEWCDAVCRAHGRPGRFAPTLWLNEQPTPPFYPNAVTLAAADIDAQLTRIATLVDFLPGGFAVKDSLACLDLAPLGFRELFAAEWITRAPGRPVAPVSGDIEWSVVADTAALCQWESAWSDGASAGVIFPPSLLSDPAITLIAGRRSGTIVAGAALYRTENVVGWSNVFAPPGDDMRFEAAALAFADRHAGGLPLVGYEHGPALDRARALGFVPLGPLRVWAC